MQKARPELDREGRDREDGVMGLDCAGGVLDRAGRCYAALARCYAALERCYTALSAQSNPSSAAEHVQPLYSRIGQGSPWDY